MLQPKLITPPEATPVTLDEAKAWAFIDFDDDDALIMSMIVAATGFFDGYSGVLGRALMPQVWLLEFPLFCSQMRLPLSPVIGVQSVKYYDVDNAEQTLSSDVYGVYEDPLGPVVELLSGQSWPASFDKTNAVKITFVAGYADAAAVPAQIKTAIKMLVAGMYDNRESQVEMGKLVENGVYTKLVAPFRRVGI